MSGYIFTLVGSVVSLWSKALPTILYTVTIKQLFLELKIHPTIISLNIFIGDTI